MTSFKTKSLTLSIALLAWLALPACTHRKVVQVGSHKVTVSRHGFEKKLHVPTRSQSRRSNMQA